MAAGRRDFLRLGLGAASLGLLPPEIRRALALPAARRSGTIEDVAHIVVFMQENRSFDHYFGHLSGVRGYNDRHPVLRADGRPVWNQPRKGDQDAVVLPFHLRTKVTSAECVLDLDHNWYPTQRALAAGRNDRWPANKTDLTMGYYLREDIPFHYALADAFTICDNYFCSTPTQTHPNRMYLMTGMVDPTGAGGGPLLDNIDYVDRKFYARVPPPFTWTTYPERLEQAGISWQVYQQGLSPSDDFGGNFGTNVLMNFKQFIEAPEGSALRRRGMTVRTIEDLAEDVKSGRLPQVSWLLPPAAFSEHPRWTPGYGATYIARILDALTADPAVWSRTVLLIMYDENDGYFDHIVPPQPPTKVRPGKSTVSTAGEVHDYVSPFDARKFHADDLPYGLGPRVGMIVVSPWSKGGFVCSEVFDHTSVIRFIERRFGVAEPNVTAWRRAVCGDLTSAFDFSAPEDAWPALPDTAGYMAAVDASCLLPAPVVPAESALSDVHAQEPGVRPARPLPYDLAVDEVAARAGGLALRFASFGAVGASFTVYREGSEEMPRRYTVGAGDRVEDEWSLAGAGFQEITVAGPNGFLRRYRRGGDTIVRVAARADAAAEALVLTLANSGAEMASVRLSDAAYGKAARTIALAPRASVRVEWNVAASGHWYDIVVTGPHGESTRLAGHVETGRPSITDPAAIAPVLTL
ncbi:MAG TPA: phospholipase C, phosphocholine-specific [Acetobacteraceae bacterium]|nr:phospholipase C, phosphocholine-specific [Acetobacteraceae bacterium]